MAGVFVLVLCAAILFSGVLAVAMGRVLPALIAAGLASLFASVVYLLLAAPDVAMAEAAIGAGLSTFVFLYALRKTGGGDDGAGGAGRGSDGGRS
ncbi:hydrogenase subunit MbhD domain-containing protein [Pseudoxanthobacter sp.]|uniref:hydrogenase subunit MbhD domain-containing protein n=1 Tax=Pseudoxanthobacter sp. TaxID=1925742 RepID=UPI002FE29062